jgi:hypothetical protein
MASRLFRSPSRAPSTLLSQLHGLLTPGRHFVSGRCHCLAYFPFNFLQFNTGQACSMSVPEAAMQGGKQRRLPSGLQASVRRWHVQRTGGKLQELPKRLPSNLWRQVMSHTVQC